MLGIQNLLSQNTRPNSVAADSGAKGAGTTTGSSGTMPNNELNANSFITLLTAQLQAQDPLNPMQPQDMMNQLVSLNSLQELIQIRQILQGVPSSTSGSGSGSGTGSGTAAANTGNAPSAGSGQVSPSASYHDAILQQKLYPAQSPANLY